MKRNITNRKLNWSTNTSSIRRSERMIYDSLTILWRWAKRGENVSKYTQRNRNNNYNNRRNAEVCPAISQSAHLKICWNRIRIVNLPGDCNEYTRKFRITTDFYRTWWRVVLIEIVKVWSCNVFGSSRAVTKKIKMYMHWEILMIFIISEWCYDGHYRVQKNNLYRLYHDSLN